MLKKQVRLGDTIQEEISTLDQKIISEEDLLEDDRNRITKEKEGIRQGLQNLFNELIYKKCQETIQDDSSVELKNRLKTFKSDLQLLDEILNGLRERKKSLDSDLKEAKEKKQKAKLKSEITSKFQEFGTKVDSIISDLEGFPQRKVNAGSTTTESGSK